MSKQEAFEAALSESVGDYLRKIAPYAGGFRPDFVRGANRIDDLERQLAEIKRQAGDATEFVLAQINADLRAELAAANERADDAEQAAEAEAGLADDANTRNKKLRARIAELDKAIDEINVGVNAGNPVIWIESISGFYMSVREAIEAAIKEQDK